MRAITVGIRLCFAGVAAGCSNVPALEEASGTKQTPVLISEVVKRVKCEIADSLADKIGRPEYQWMADWTAKVDLTLQANDQGGVTPGVTYTKFLQNAFNFGAGSTSLTSNSIAAVNQFFSVGAGANLGEQAVRAEVVSFTLSLRELRNWKYPPRHVRSDYNLVCPRQNGIELTGNLGLKEWVDSALYPVDISDLQAGVHPSPVSVAKPTLSPESHVTTYASGESMPYDEALKRLEAANTEAAADLKDATTNTKAIDSYISQINKAMKPYLAVMEPNLKSQISSTLADLSKLSKTTHSALSQVTTLQGTVAATYKIVKNDTSQSNPPSSNVLAIENDARDATAQEGLIADAQSEANKAATAIFKVNPPLDALLHSVEFIVTYGATLAPGWTLLQWKAPSANGSSISASGERTNVLNIALGPTGNAEQDRLIQNQTISSPH